MTTATPAAIAVTTTTIKPSGYLGPSFGLKANGPTRFPVDCVQLGGGVVLGGQHHLPRQYPMYSPEEDSVRLVYPAVLASDNPINTAYPAPVDGRIMTPNNSAPRADNGAKKSIRAATVVNTCAMTYSHDRMFLYRKARYGKTSIIVPAYAPVGITSSRAFNPL